MEVFNLNKSFGDNPIIKNFTYYFKKNERLGIVGKNGIGKSTLLKLLSGKINPDSGYVKPGINTSIGYFEQTVNTIESGLRVLEYIKKNVAEYITIGEGIKISASQMLEKFLFPSKMQSLEVQKLSGGERRRLYLVEILMRNPNFLILDEPTNDLDIKTLSILEEFLLDFPGTVVIVSHDRYFMDRICSTILYFSENGKLETFVGIYSDFLIENSKKKSLEKSKENSEKNNESNDSKKNKEPKLSYKEKKELEIIENDINNLEKEKIKLEEKFNHPDKYLNLNSLSKELEEVTKNLERKYVRWDELLSKNSS